jgi:hypothetical protein
MTDNQAAQQLNEARERLFSPSIADRPRCLMPQLPPLFGLEPLLELTGSESGASPSPIANAKR